MRRAGLLLAACVLPAAVLVPSPPAVGAEQPTLPLVGECYDLSDAQAQAGGYWTPSDPVPCSTAHTFEVTETGLLPMDVNAFEFAADHCGSLDVWTAVGVNASEAGIIDDPLRVEPRSFAWRPAPASFVCGAVAVDYHGTEPSTLVPLTSSLERLRTRVQASLRHCASAEEGRSALAPPITVPCGSRPRWQATRWLIWSALYDDYPGRTVLRQRARELCGRDAVVSVPTARQWNAGMPRTWCYQKYP